MRTFTHDEMVERFGTAFIAGWEGIKEVYEGLLAHRPSFYSDPVQALNALDKQAEERLLNEKARIYSILLEYDSLPLWKRTIYFFTKSGWKKNRIVSARHKEIAARLKEEYYSNTDKFENRTHLNQDAVYTMNIPDLSIGDMVYISVTQNNLLDVGVYEVTVCGVEYYIYYDDDTSLQYTASVVTSCGQELTLRESNDKHLTDGYAHHEVHLNKEEAAQRVKKHLTKQGEKVFQQLAEMEKEYGSK